jgi:hypothetical protein
MTRLLARVRLRWDVEEEALNHDRWQLTRVLGTMLWPAVLSPQTGEDRPLDTKHVKNRPLDAEWWVLRAVGFAHENASSGRLSPGFCLYFHRMVDYHRPRPARPGQTPRPGVKNRPLDIEWSILN